MFSQLRPYYTSAALRGGWNTLQQTPVYSDEEQTAINEIIRQLGLKYGLSAPQANELIAHIYTFDNLIAQGLRDDAVIRKKMFIGGDPMRGKAWNFARKYIHLGYYPDGNQRKQMMAAAKTARAADIVRYQNTLSAADVPWVGSARHWRGMPSLPGYKGILRRLAKEYRDARKPTARKYASPYGLVPVEQPGREVVQGAKRVKLAPTYSWPNIPPQPGLEVISPVMEAVDMDSPQTASPLD